MSVIQYKPRVQIEVLVNVIVDGGRPRLARTGNISPSGMLLEISEPLSIGHQLEMKLFLPGTRKQLHLAGEVTREDGRTEDAFRYGVRFNGVAPEIESELQHFVDTRLERHRPA